MNINSTIAMPLKFYTPAPDRAPQTTEQALSDVLTDQKKKKPWRKSFTQRRKSLGRESFFITGMT
ncbi:hypothetical protein [Pseudomonas viridiflava]|uniref:hypothetical protein n=1 Tax=Pseudomonas viridiflava TaxID=33069 RepID=UPI001C3151AC|nr:hypothetical protein [Pseudomonas viridiflava]QXG36757.1 hypothetical protein KTT61_06020 [Pseudomonas viridiflava]QXG39900.1 hypothetical protein KTT55_21435 [Pseudomonas viridiflava]